ARGGLAARLFVLAARAAVADGVSGLDAGADDYLVKPFAPEELAARLRALRRRGRADGPRYVVGDLALDMSTRRARRAGRSVELTAREAALLELLMRRPHAVISRDIALEEVWGAQATAGVVDRYLGFRRRELGAPPVTHTVRGVGFPLRA